MKPIIDISYWQPPSAIDYDTLAGEISGVILRCSYGTTNRETAFDRHYQEFTQRGVPVGAYHFLTSYQDVAPQAVKVHEMLAGKNLPMGFWIDVENEGTTPAPSEAQILAFRNALPASIPVEGIYTRKNLGDPIFGNDPPFPCKLWVANYTTAPEPLIPIAWATWWLWQYSSGGSLPGYSGRLDMNRFWGDEDDFAAWIAGEPVEPQLPEPMYQARVSTTPPNRLIVRHAPPNGTAWSQADWLQSGALVDVYEERLGYCRISPLQDKWASHDWLAPVGGEPPVVVGKPYYGGVFGQRDPRWKDERLGSSSSTIGNYGCLLCSATTACNVLGYAENPHDLNIWMRDHGGYYQDNLWIWQKLCEKLPNLVYEGLTYNPTDAMMAQAISEGRPPLIQVDFNEGTPAMDMHWVIGIGVDDNGGVIIHDPWYDDITLLRSRYRKQITRFGSYRRAA